MKKIVWVSLVLCLLIMFMACEKASVQLPSAAPVELLPLPVQTPESEPDEVEDVVYSPYGPIVVNGFLLGGYDAGWIDEHSIFDKIQDEESYRIYVDGIFNGVETGKKTPEKDPESGDEGYYGNTVQFAFHDSYDDDKNWLAVSSDYDPFIRPVQWLNTEDEAHQDIVQSVARDNGFASLKLTLQDVVRADVDGDGAQELIISANNVATYYEDGVFASVLFMQKTSAGNTTNYFIDKTFISLNEDEEGTMDLNRYKVLGLCDLNHNGMLELIVRSDGIDMLEYGIFEFRENSFILVMSDGAGA